VSRIARILTAALATVLLAGCGGSTPRTQSPAPPLTLLPSADPYTSAIVATKSLGTARLVVNAVHPGATVRGEGVTVLGSGQGDVTWSAGATPYRELLNGRGLYVQTPPGSGGWEKWPVSATSGYIDSLRGLGALRDVVNEGPERLGSVATTRYRGWLPLTRDEATRLGLAGTPAADAREDVTVWIDDFDHAVRVDRFAATDQDSVTSRTDFSDFSVLLNLTSPSHDVTATRS
jgi:hypothetical protein